MSNENVILTVEDDAAIRRGIVDALKFSGYRPLQADNGSDGLRMAIRCDYDLLLLDLALPGVEGLDILAEIRRVRPTQPVIILTARGDENDRVQGLKLGADDYVVKPFSIKELMARVEAVLRRSPGRPMDLNQLDFLHGHVDFARREIRYLDGHRSELSEREMDLLRYLANHQGRAIDRKEILENVWQISSKGISTRTIDMHIARLREKLKDNSTNPEILLTVRGKGYMFKSSK